MALSPLARFWGSFVFQMGIDLGLSLICFCIGVIFLLGTQVSFLPAGVVTGSDFQKTFSFILTALLSYSFPSIDSQWQFSSKRLNAR